jgi:hypothetical protein
MDTTPVAALRERFVTVGVLMRLLNKALDPFVTEFPPALPIK